MKKNTVRQIYYHLIFWVVYLFLWGARDMVFYPVLLANVVLNLIFSLPVIPFVYFNLFFLVPKYLFRKKWAAYSLFFSVGFILSACLRYYLYQLMFIDILKVPDAAETFSGWNGVIILASENMIVVAISMALYLIGEWYGKERYTRELEQKNVESELEMLKSQLQPHFLFNNLNTVYFLMETNPALAKEVMIRFSDVLSHQLYNAKKDKVPLADELKSLESYLEIQKVRHEDFLDLHYSFPEQTDSLQVAPMILMAFIENAFKHSQREEGYHIDITVEVQDKNLRLHVSNSNAPAREDNCGGVGLDNVKRRLELIYPGKHKLSINKTEETYIVDLNLTLETNGQAEVYSR